MAEKSVYVLYGSQTGNAESIAEDLAQTLIEDQEIPCICQTLNYAKPLALKDLANFVLIVCSTTGNGDAPENADAWWRGVKLRSAPKDKFEGVNFAVLALGDTNYDKFCHMGTMIDKRMSELGGERKLALSCADEATNMEETVEKWKSDIISLLKETTAS